MKFIIYLSALIGVISAASVVLASPLVGDGTKLLGAKECTWGPSYWCKNLTAAKSCNAVRHCIQTVWEKQNVPEDTDSICQICKDMVKQARDQLRSNETMDEIRQVFEGSCDLIPIKIAKKECKRLADDFIPELVEALSAQMNPDQVCSVAGLCNNAEFDRVLTKYYAAALDGTLGQLNCDNCNNVATLITNKFTSTDRDEILENILHLCGEMSSFSDACSNIVLTYFNDIYEHLQSNLKSSSICHVSGVCASKYHVHDDEKVDDEANDLIDGDDIPCELCEQLIRHLRDVLVANTTESEFKQVLEGLCKQSKGFKTECLSIVDQYYDVIYNSLVNNLNETGACFLIGVCPKGVNTYAEAEIRPLLPVFPPAEIKVTIRKKLGSNEPKFTQDELQSMVLPIDKLMGAPNPLQLVDGGELCTFCEYLLHFIQDELATPATEDEIKKTIGNVCNKFSVSLRGQCHNFIDMYGDAVIALLIQGLNPRDVCPKLQMCPQNNDIEVFSPTPLEIASDESDKPTCPLCLFAVEEAQTKIKDDKSKAHIKDVLDHLCNHLPTKLQGECVDFVNTYSTELIDKLIGDFKPQEICISLKLCPKPNTYIEELGLSLMDSSEEENVINDSQIDIGFGIDVEMLEPSCLICEELVKIAEKQMTKNKSKQEIADDLKHSCDKIKLTLRKKCHKMIDHAADQIADLIFRKTAVKEICKIAGFCLWSEEENLMDIDNLKYDLITSESTNTIEKSERIIGLDDITVKDPPNCVLCEFIMTKLEIELKDKTAQDEIKHTIEHICQVMPKSISKSCNKFIDQYANTIFILIGTTPPKEICRTIQLCSASLEVVTDEVIECGICHGASMYLMPYFKEHSNPSVIVAQEMVTIGCENLPAKYYHICTEMITIYGPSILHLSEKENINESQICSEIGKCFESEKSGLAFAKISA